MRYFKRGGLYYVLLDDGRLVFNDRDHKGMPLRDWPISVYNGRIEPFMRSGSIQETDSTFGEEPAWPAHMRVSEGL